MGQHTRTPLNLLGTFVLIAARTCIPTIAYAVQQKPASNSGEQPSSHNEESGTAQTSQPSKEIQSCTQKASDKETWTQSDRSPLHAVYLSWQASTFHLPRRAQQNDPHPSHQSRRFIADRSGAAGAQLVMQSRHTLLHEASPPFAHGGVTQSKLPGYSLIHLPRRAQQNDPHPSHQSRRKRA